MPNVKSIFSYLCKSFKANGVPNPRASTYQILEKTLHRTPDLRQLAASRLSLYHMNKIRKYAERRMRHEPIEYIIRDVEFRGLSLEQERPVWIPGPETRDLVDTVLEFCPKDKDKVHILEVGCGSGAVSLSLLDERDNIKILAIDDSWRALDLARKNFRHIFGKEGEKEGKIKFKRFPYHDFTKKNVKKFDIIISDPPNLRTSEWEKLTKEKKYYEARQALDGGKYGLDVVWELIRDSADNLKHDGLLIISVTNEQADYLTQYFKDNNGVAHDLKILTTRENEQLKSTYMIFQRVCNETEKIEPSKIEIIQEGGI